MQKNFIILTFVILLTLMLTACENYNHQNDYVATTNNLTEEIVTVDYKHIIPLPAEFTSGNNYFNVSKTDFIIVDNKDTLLTNVALYLKTELTKSKVSTVSIQHTNKEKLNNTLENKNAIVLSLNSSLSGGKEVYEITIEDHLISIVGKTAEGVFRGVQTLKALFPVNQDGKLLALKTGVIRDYPRYEHRGFMLDVARHFYTVQEVKEIIDYLATYKYNVFHFHLTDDQGWRINIPNWPKLTSIGSNSAVGQTSCDNCFYSLDEYEEIVQYADERFITLIPEIDVPGHVRAALASYPDELYCDGDKPVWPYTGIEVRISSLCFSNPQIYDFFEDVIREIATRTTGNLIHVGGDETPKWVKPQDYADFMLKANDIVNKYGKTLMGWTNDLGTVDGLSADAVGQDWSTKNHCCDNTLNMARRGSNIVMSPANKAYLDMKYDKDTSLGLNWAGYNSIKNSYNWNPEDMIVGLNPNNIIGVEAALWGETITSMRDAQYMIFPRLLSISEVAWSAQKKRNWQDFSKRLEHEYIRLKAQNIHYKENNLYSE